jgi:hypothetical protein
MAEKIGSTFLFLSQLKVCEKKNPQNCKKRKIVIELKLSHFNAEI